VLTELSLSELGERFRRREVTPTEAALAYLERIDAVDGEVRAFLTVTREHALAQAAAADARFHAGQSRGPLDGVPVALKDLFCTRGIRTTSGSKILERFVPPYDATVVARLVEAGAVVLGKLNMDEFAMGSSTEHSGFFTTRNPWDVDRVPGGSSGGASAAVAAGMAAASLGTDTGGSIRQPAAFCGTVGFKPTYGRVSRYGVIAFASSLDQVGPFGRTVEDVALMLQVIAGADPMDSTAVATPVPDSRAELGRGVEGLRIGIPSEYFIDGMSPEVESAVRAAIATLERLGARTEPVSLPHTEYGLAAYYVIAPAEASSNLARYDGVKYGLRAPGGKDLIEMYAKTRAAGFGDEVKRRIMLGTYALSAGYYDAYYGRALKVRTLVRRDFQEAFERVNLIAAPTTPGVAFKLGEKADPLSMYLNDVLTIPVNLAGLPGISVPAGFTGGGLPIGLQLIGRAFDEATVLRAAHAYERATDWHTRRPKLGPNPGPNLGKDRP
jgi:aspartyl-tRNA(Asn)/glutamyl-tRNA(Gln) amidotransferase subunit A